MSDAQTGSENERMKYLTNWKFKDSKPDTPSCLKALFSCKNLPHQSDISDVFHPANILGVPRAIIVFDKSDFFGILSVSTSGSEL